MRIDPRSRTVRAIVWTIAGIIALAAFALTIQRTRAEPLDQGAPPPNCTRTPRVSIYVEPDRSYRDVEGDYRRMTLFLDDRYRTWNNGVQELTVTRIDNLIVSLPDGSGPPNPDPAAPPSVAPLRWTLHPSYFPTAFGEYRILMKRVDPARRIFLAITLRDRCGTWNTFWGAP